MSVDGLGYLQYQVDEYVIICSTTIPVLVTIILVLIIVSPAANVKLTNLSNNGDWDCEVDQG